MAPDDEAAGAGHVDDVQWRTAADELAQRFVQPGQIAADAAHVADFAVVAGDNYLERSATTIVSG